MSFSNFLTVELLTYSKSNGVVRAYLSKALTKIGKST